MNTNKHTLGFIVAFLAACFLSIFAFLMRELGTYVSPQACNFMVIFSAFVFSSAYSYKSFSVATFKSLKKSHLIKFIILGICTFFGNSSLALALHYLEPPVVQAIQRSELLFVIMFAVMFLHERMSMAVLTAATAMVAGIALLYSFDDGTETKLWHYGLPIITAVSFAGLSVIMQTIQDLPPAFINANRLFFNLVLIIFFPGVLTEVVNAPTQAFIVAGVAGFFGPFLNRISYINAARMIGVSRASIILGIAPIFGLGVHSLFFGAQITISQILGILFLIFGTSIVVIYDKKGK